MQEDKIYSRTKLNLKKILSVNKNDKKGNNIFFIIIIIIVIAIATFFEISKVINPIINELCVNKAKNIATKIANEEATIIMDKYSYEDLITIVRNESGEIKMLQISTKNINQIMSDISINIIKRFEEKDNMNIYIHLGNIFGLKIFSTIGPKIPIRIANVGNIDTKLESEFQAQGINQILHRIYISLKCEVTLLTPYNSIKQTIDNQVLIAESVIMGSVPNYLYNNK